MNIAAKGKPDIAYNKARFLKKLPHTPVGLAGLKILDEIKKGGDHFNRPFYIYAA